MLEAWWSGRRFADTVTERIDPTLQVTLNLALSHNLIALKGGQNQRVMLTELGSALAESLSTEPDLMTTEKSFLNQLGNLSDAQIARKLGNSISTR